MPLHVRPAVDGADGHAGGAGGAGGDVRVDAGGAGGARRNVLQQRDARKDRVGGAAQSRRRRLGSLDLRRGSGCGRSEVVLGYD